MTDAVIELLSAIPGPEGHVCRALWLHPGVTQRRSREAQANVLRAAEEADTLAGVYHSDHREIAAHDPHWPLKSSTTWSCSVPAWALNARTSTNG